MSNYLSITVPVISLLLVVFTGTANAIQLDTGKWKISMQSRNPMTGQPIDETSFECIDDENFNPAEEMMNDGTCRVTDMQESDNAVSWKIVCGGGDMPEFHGEGSFVSRGNSAEGEMKMIMKMGAHTMEMRNVWHGEKVSSKCDSM